MRHINQKTIRKEIKTKAKKQIKTKLYKQTTILLIITIIFIILTQINKITKYILIIPFIITISPLILKYYNTILNKPKIKYLKETKFTKLFTTYTLTLLITLWIFNFIPIIGQIINIIIIIYTLPITTILPFVYIENKNQPNKEIIEKTAKIIKNKTKFYGLLLSFTPWIILSLLTLGILFIYTIPYILISFKYLYKTYTNNIKIKKTPSISDKNIIIIFITILLFIAATLTINTPKPKQQETLTYGKTKITYEKPKDYTKQYSTKTTKTYTNKNNILQYSIYLSSVKEALQLDKDINKNKQNQKEFKINHKGKKLQGYQYSDNTSSTTIIYYPKDNYIITISLTTTNKNIKPNDIKPSIKIQ